MIHCSLSVTSLIYQALHPLFVWNCSRNVFKVKPESLSPPVGRDTEFKCAWLMVIMSPPSVDGYHSDIRITKEDTGYDPHFPAHTHMGPKVSSPLVKEPPDTLCKWPALTFSLLLLFATRVELLSNVRAAWTSAKPVQHVFLFWHPKAPALGEAWQRTSQREQ